VRPELIGLALLAVWFGGLLVVTPLYSPYVRLTLPWLIAAAIGAALNLAAPLADWEVPEMVRWSEKWRFVAIASVLGGVCLVPWLFFRRDFDFGWPLEGREVQRIARLIHEERAEAVRVVYVFGEPAMYFQLRAAAEELVAPVENVPERAREIEGRAVPTFLVAGPHAMRDPSFVEQLGRAAKWKLIKEWRYRPSVLVWLDLSDPRVAPRGGKGDASFKLFKFEP
jgi:hypothetical protein